MMKMLFNLNHRKTNVNILQIQNDLIFKNNLIALVIFLGNAELVSFVELNDDHKKDFDVGQDLTQVQHLGLFYLGFDLAPHGKCNQ